MLSFYTTADEAQQIYQNNDVALIWANYGQQQVKALQKVGAHVAYVNPSEGALAWLDNWAITKRRQGQGSRREMGQLPAAEEDQRRAYRAHRLRQHGGAEPAAPSRTTSWSGSTLSRIRPSARTCGTRSRRRPDLSQPRFAGPAVRTLWTADAGSLESCDDRARTCSTLRSVSKSYGATPVLHDIDLAVRDGEFMTLLGPSGSGKTTILRLIGGFTAPSAARSCSTAATSPRCRSTGGRSTPCSRTTRCSRT